VNTPCDWVVEAPRLGALLVPNEHHRRAPILQLRQWLAAGFHMCYTSKGAEEMNRWLLAVPYLIWCLPFDALGG
jgi:hypothetical protein